MREGSQLFDYMFGEVHRDETETLGYRASDRFGITRRRNRTARDASVRLVSGFHQTLGLKRQKRG